MTPHPSSASASVEAPTVEGLMDLVRAFGERSYDCGIEFVASGDTTEATDAEHAAFLAIRSYAESLASAPPAAATVEGLPDLHAKAHECGAFRFVQKVASDPPSYFRFTDAQLAAFAVRVCSAPSSPEPIDMVLFCPKCGTQHVDAPEVGIESMQFRDVAIGPHWSNPPHRSHLCHGCGHIWRPADVPTNGVAAVKTRGKADSPLAAPAAPVEAQPGANAEELLNDIESDVSAIDTRYRGDPSYDHDAYWMKDRVLKVIARHRAALPDAQPVARVGSPSMGEQK